MSDLLRFLLELAVIIAGARLLGVLMGRIGQPTVIGEITAGILLGPCLLGWVAPTISRQLFPPQNLPLLASVSQLGLILFMFMVGMRLDPRHLVTHQRSAIVISATSILLPFAGGFVLAYALYDRLAPAGVSAPLFGLYIGIVMSITAFPVLARILVETGLASTRLGSIAIACAAADDVVAWLLLAVAVGIARPGAAPVPWWQPILLLGGYASIVMLIRPLLARFDRGPIGHDRLALIVLASVLSAAATEWIGIHALFGAFFIGLAMPKRREFVDQVSRMLEPLSLVALLPVFFAVTGLRMAPLALDWRLWADLLLIICIATAGKWGGAVLAGRFTGLPWREASSLGVLLNTRGLIQLVMLDIGKDLGILTPGTFSLLVIAALVTTAMTTPLLRLTTPAKTLAATAR